jgi:hypothetical protein
VRRHLSYSSGGDFGIGTLQTLRGGFVGEQVDKDLVIHTLAESNEILQQEVRTLRNSNRILRTVFRSLRATVESQRKQLEAATFNDEAFKSFCAEDFGAPVESVADAGLADATGSVEPLTIG